MATKDVGRYLIASVEDEVRKGLADYLTNPSICGNCSRACARCCEGSTADVWRARDTEPGRYRSSGWQLDRRTRRLTDPDDASVALTKGEYALLIAFLEAPPAPPKPRTLLQATRVHEHVFDRSIDV